MDGYGWFSTNYSSLFRTIYNVFWVTFLTWYFSIIYDRYLCIYIYTRLYKHIFYLSIYIYIWLRAPIGCAFFIGNLRHIHSASFCAAGKRPKRARSHIYIYTYLDNVWTLYIYAYLPIFLYNDSFLIFPGICACMWMLISSHRVNQLAMLSIRSWNYLELLMVPRFSTWKCC